MFQNSVEENTIFKGEVEGKDPEKTVNRSEPRQKKTIFQDHKERETMTTFQNLHEKQKRFTTQAN